jgi:acyl-CoA thioesterase
MYEFDADTQVTKIDAEHFKCELSDRWNIGKIPNGGYVMAVATRVMESLLPHPDILTVSAHYAKPTLPGPVDLLSRVVYAGSSISTGTVRLLQNGEEKICFAATAGQLDAGSDNYEAEGPPSPPAIEECTKRVIVPGITPVMYNMLDCRMAYPATEWLQGRQADEMVMCGYARFADERPPDKLSLVLFSDMFPPTVFSKYGLNHGWIPTLQLNVQIRRSPAPGWLWCWIKTRHLTNGLFEEDSEIWDSDGNLVAISRQLARWVR